MDNAKTLNTDMIPYKFHPILVFRNPRLPLSANFENNLPDEKFLESIFLASPTVYEETIKCIHKDKNSIPLKLKNTLYKYYLRSSNRCTPFGLFAGCGTVPWGKENNRIILNPKNITRHARLDMDYLFLLSQKLFQIEVVKKSLLFYANNSIYQIGNEFRYVEKLYENGSHNYHICSVEKTESLCLVLDLVKNGAKLAGIIKMLSEDHPSDDAEKFVQQLIDAQLVVSDLQPKLTGEDFLGQIIKLLQTLDTVENISIDNYLCTLKKTEALLVKIQYLETGHIEVYKQITGLLGILDVQLDKSKILQVDFSNKIESGCINIALQQQLLDALVALNKLTVETKNTDIGQFCKDFNHRYGERELPLLHVLDPETGIGYSGCTYSFPSPIIEGIISKKDILPASVSWTRVEAFLHKILLLNQRSSIIELKEDDLSGLSADWENTPLSMSVIFKILDGSDKLVQIQSAGNASASTLLGRFANNDRQINDICNDISKWEYDAEQGKIIAEIVFQPENRVSNIMIRPATREYEIPCLSQSSLNKENQIELSDLMVSIKNNTIYLRSKKLDKEVIPRLGNAHNFKKSELPIYRFLCDLQTQNVRSNLGFDWGELKKIYKKFPRLVYKNTILSLAWWAFTKDDFSEFFLQKDQNILNKIGCFRQTNGLPSHILFSEGDNELLIDFENEVSVHVFIDTIKGKEKIILKEFIQPCNSPVTNCGNQDFASEFVCTLLKTNNDRPNFYRKPDFKKKDDNVTRDFAFGTKWNYYKLYCGTKTAERILTNAIKPLTDELLDLKLIDKWFYIRYNDPDFHLRLRFSLINNNSFGAFITIVAKHLQPFIDTGHIWKQQTETYSRELERYGPENIEIAESLFYYDSAASLQLLAIPQCENFEEIRWMYTLRSINNLLDCFAFDLIKKKRLMGYLSNLFAKEHNADKDLNLSLDKTYRKYKKNAWGALDLQGIDDHVIEILRIADKNKAAIITIAQKMTVGYEQEMEVGKLESFIQSQVHMMVNRAVVADQRVHELVFYHILYSYYQSKCILQKAAAVL